LSVVYHSSRYGPESDLFRRLLLITTIFCLLIFCWQLGGLPLLSLNEGRRALVIKEMFLSSNWILPTQNGELYLTKPPLLYWFSLIFSYIVGEVNEWTLRLPSAIAAISIVAMVYSFSKKHFGAWTALFSVQILITNVAFAMLGRRVEIEMLLAALCVGALLAALKYTLEGGKIYWIYLSYGLLGLAILTKGPVAMLFVTLPLLAVWLWTKSPLFKAVLINKTGWLIFLLVGLSWYTAVTMQLGTDVWISIMQNDMVNKMQGESVGKPLLSYIGWIATDFILLIGLLGYQPKRLWQVHKHQFAFISICAVVVLTVLTFSAFSNKHAKYLLPMYPCLAILLGIQLNRLFEAYGPKVKNSIITLGLLIPLVYVVFYAVTEAKVFDYRVNAFSKFATWSGQMVVEQFYAYPEIDSRLIYYSKKPIQVLSEKSFGQLVSNQSLTPLDQKSFVIITEGETDKIATLATCQLITFKPYLKNKQTLTVFGFGDVCQPTQ
jgi:4-amino-4-deoxy-L-arabinose transferase-like glycosyltransferase